MVCACSSWVGKRWPQRWHCSGRRCRISSTLSLGTKGRCAPRCPGCPPGLRRLFLCRPRWRGAPANPSEEGGLEELLEFCFRNASCRSRSTICFSFSPSCFCCSRTCLSSSATRSRRRSSSRSRDSRFLAPWLGSDKDSRNRRALTFPTIPREILAIIHHSVTEPLGFVQPYVGEGCLNCYPYFDQSSP